MAVQKLSCKNQIIIPKEARQAMGVKGGDELLVVVKDDLMLVMPKPKRYAQRAARAGQRGLLARLSEAGAWFLVENVAVRGLPDDRQGIGLDINLFIYFLEVIRGMGPGVRPCLIASSVAVILL